MELRKLIAIGLLMSLQGCATPYRPPTEQPPPEWTGISGWEVLPQTIEVHEGTRQPGDVLIEYGVQPRRTAVVLETVQTKSAYGRDLIIPEGTKLFAENFTLVRRAGWTGQKEVKQPIDPIEWCAVLPHGIDGKQAELETVCLFWESPTQARYMQNFGGSPTGFHPRMGATSGMPGPVPKIKVQPVDFGVTLVSRVRVTKVSAKRIDLEEVLSDGKAEERTNQFGFSWQDGRKAAYRNVVGQFELTASEGYSSVQLAETSSSRAARAPGQPVVHVCVDGNGALQEEPQIVRSSGNPQLDDAALQTAKQGRYARGKGQTGPDCFDFKVRFELEEP